MSGMSFLSGCLRPAKRNPMIGRSSCNSSSVVLPLSTNVSTTGYLTPLSLEPLSIVPFELPPLFIQRMSTSLCYAVWNVAPSNSSYCFISRLPTARRRRWLQEALPQYGFILLPKRRYGFIVPRTHSRLPQPVGSRARRGDPPLAASGNGGRSRGEE